MQNFRCAIIGCGNSSPGKGGVHSIAYAHGWSFAANSRTKLIAAASRTKKNVDDFVAEFPGTKPYQDYQQMLAKEKPDFVSVCAFPREREEMVMAALENGAKVIWAEKPFAITMPSAHRMNDAAKKRGARIFVNHQRRYGKAFELFRSAVKDKLIGELVSIDVVQPGNCIMNFGPHLVDAAVSVFGDRKAERIMAGADPGDRAVTQGLPGESQLVATVHLSDGVRITLEAGNKGPGKSPILRANGSEGFAELLVWIPDSVPGVFRAKYAGQSQITQPKLDEHFHHGADENLFYHRGLADMLNSIDTGEPSQTDVSEAMKVTEIILGALESARTRKLVTLPLQMPDVFPLENVW